MPIEMNFVGDPNPEPIYEGVGAFLSSWERLTNSVAAGVASIYEVGIGLDDKGSLGRYPLYIIISEISSFEARAQTCRKLILQRDPAAASRLDKALLAAIKFAETRNQLAHGWVYQRRINNVDEGFALFPPDYKTTQFNQLQPRFRYNATMIRALLDRLLQIEVEFDASLRAYCRADVDVGRSDYEDWLTSQS